MGLPDTLKAPRMQTVALERQEKSCSAYHCMAHHELDSINSTGVNAQHEGAVCLCSESNARAFVRVLLDKRPNDAVA